MSDVTQRIAAFSKDPEVILESLAMLKVGREKGDSAEEIMAHVIASALLRFNAIPVAPSARQHVQTLPNGMKLYKVKLVGGAFDGTESICSHDTVIAGGERYLRGADDLYYYTPEGAGRN